MTLTDIVVQQIIKRLLRGEDYRVEILALIDAAFLQYAIDFFGKVAQAKLRDEPITDDWYKREFILNPTLLTKEIAVNTGLNMKSIKNMYNTEKRELVLEVAPQYYDNLYSAIMELFEQNTDIEITLTIRFRGVSVDLNLTESMIVINTLAVKRAEIRGGAWSTAGKSVEKYLVRTLCELYSVPPNHYISTGLSEQRRELDFILIDNANNRYQGEVKLMGQGNPESADGAFARGSQIFIADTLLPSVRRNLTEKNIHWVELRIADGYRKFLPVLQSLDIPCQDFAGNVDDHLPQIFERIFPPV